MSGYERPATPSGVERQLRQEAGFGCAKCGHPYLEFHHIIPLAIEQHSRCEDMVALCKNCHVSLALQGKDRQYEVKNDPFNIKRGHFFGALEYDKRDLIFKVGGNWYENVPIILQYRSIPIIACVIEENQAKVSLNIFDPSGKIILRVDKNVVVFRIDEM